MISNIFFTFLITVSQINLRFIKDITLIFHQMLNVNVKQNINREINLSCNSDIFQISEIIVIYLQKYHVCKMPLWYLQDIKDHCDDFAISQIDFSNYILLLKLSNHMSLWYRCECHCDVFANIISCIFNYRH